jgi:predicted N-acetyltransferase YhbS
VSDPEVLPPERLADRHDLSTFRNGRHPALDRWLQDMARKSEGLSARTYVMCLTDEPNRVVGYYSLSALGLHRAVLSSAKLRRGLPEEVPALLIGHLAVDKDYQGVGLGADLLYNALKRCLAVSEMAAARAVVVHVIDDAAAAFYGRYGFIASLPAPNVLILPMEDARAAL